MASITCRQFSEIHNHGLNGVAGSPGQGRKNLWKVRQQQPSSWPMLVRKMANSRRQFVRTAARKYCDKKLCKQRQTTQDRSSELHPSCFTLSHHTVQTFFFKIVVHNIIYLWNTKSFIQRAGTLHSRDYHKIKI